MGRITIKNNLNEETREDAEKVKDLLKRHGSRVKAVIGGSQDKLKVTFMSGSITKEFIDKLSRESNLTLDKFIFETSSELYIYRR